MDTSFPASGHLIGFVLTKGIMMCFTPDWATNLKYLFLGPNYDLKDFLFPKPVSHYSLSCWRVGQWITIHFGLFRCILSHFLPLPSRMSPSFVYSSISLTPGKNRYL